MPNFYVVAVPSDAHTETNCVFVNPADAATVGPVTLINGFPFNVTSDDGVAVGKVALNGIQRKCVGVSSIALDAVSLPSGGFSCAAALEAITFEMDTATAASKGGEIDVKDAVEKIQQRFGGQFFKIDQRAVIRLSGRFLVRVTVSKGGDANGIGRLTPETVVAITVKEESGLTLKNIPDHLIDAAQPGIVQNFNLESLGIGGLRAEFAEVFRRAFASRIFPQSVVKKLGLKHVKGVLLFGPPGTGKTLIARKIGEILNTRPPKIVNGPEVFNKFVGGTEENVRKLFADAEAEQAAKGDQSQLHLIIFDEFDAICKQRGAVRDNTGVADNVVNQLLSKIDGVSALNNVLLIGMTNRKDLIDEAILRPGRFEVHVEIGLPDEQGRLEIFRIHTRGMRNNDVMGSDVRLESLAAKSKNFSGAEIEGVVRSATSYAFSRHIDFDNPTQTIDASKLTINMDDFTRALVEVTPAFGNSEDTCESLTRGGIIDYGPSWQHITREIADTLRQLTSYTHGATISILLHGLNGSGKSAAAAHFAIKSAFPFVKFVLSKNLVSYGEVQKSNIIRKAFEDSYRSSTSVIVLDDLERLVEYSHLGGRYSNILLQTLLVLIKEPPPEGKRLLVIGTTSMLDVIETLELQSCFSLTVGLPTLDGSSLAAVARHSGARFASQTEEDNCVKAMPSSVPIKQLLFALDRAKSEDGKVSAATFTSAMDVLRLRRR